MKKLLKRALVLVLGLAFGFVSIACTCPKLAKLPPSATTYTVKRQCKLDEAVKAGKYDATASRITNFPVPEGCVEGEEVEVHLFRGSELVHYPCKTRTHTVVARIHERSYQPADWTVLLPLGAKYPELQRQVWIAGLGSKWWDSEGNEFVPFLNSTDEGERILQLAISDSPYGWCDSYFAAVRM